MKKSQNILKKINEQLQLGHSLTSICRAKDMPNVSTVYAWMNEDPELKKLILENRRIGAMTWLDKMQDLLESDVEPQQVQWAREKLHHARWMASKLVSVFNDKIVQENIGEPQIKIVWDDGYSEHKADDLAHTLRSTDKVDDTKHNKPNDKSKIN